MKLSIVVPVFNEEKTILSVLEALDVLAVPKAEKEIIVVDDGSSDATATKIGSYLKAHKKAPFVFIQHKKNIGKGAAVKTGIDTATGDYIVIQDADLEYNPKDIIKLFTKVAKDGVKVVYGTRLKRLPHFSREERTSRFLMHYLGNKFLSLITSVLYGQWITDMETCYKLFPRDVAQKLVLHARGFEFEPEITAKLLKAGMKIYEVPITTTPRGYSEGKKLDTVKDGQKALWTLFKYRFIS